MLDALPDIRATANYSLQMAVNHYDWGMLTSYAGGFL